MLRQSVRIAFDAFDRFIADDGWAIASHIALSALMALFPFIIVVTSLADTLSQEAESLDGEVRRFLTDVQAA